MKTTRLFMKWAFLTDAQREQVKSFYKKELEEKTIILQNNSYRIHSGTGEFMNETL